MKYRIAFGGIHTESSTFNPLLTKTEDFSVLRGDALRRSDRYRFLDAYTDAEFLPTLHARALPGGPVALQTYQAFKTEFLSRLAALGPVDGLYLDMHGAMNVSGLDDAEGDWLGAAREVVGPDCLIVASYDLHGNLSKRIINALDGLSAFRTAPHIDVLGTKQRACTLLVEALRGGTRPQLVWVPVPVVLPGEMTSTEDEPARSLYGSLPHIDALDGVLDASLLVGYVWADEPRAGASVVLTGTDAAVLEREAVQLATRYWEARREFHFGVPAGSLAECLRMFENLDSYPAILSDSGDNPTGGGVGDTTFILAELLERDLKGAVIAGLADAPAVNACYAAGVGGELELSLGATLDPETSQPLPVRAHVVYLHPAEAERDRQAVVRVGAVTVILSAARRPYHYPADVERLGIKLSEARLLVVKSGYLTAELTRAAAHTLLALTPGTVSQELSSLSYRRQGPRFPLEPTLSWTPAPYATEVS